MANHETHSVIAGGIESDLHIDSSKYPHPFCSLLQKRAHFDSFKHLIFIRGLLVIAHGKRKNKISASMVSFYVSLVQVMCAHYIPDTNKVNLWGLRANGTKTLNIEGARCRRQKMQ